MQLGRTRITDMEDTKSLKKGKRVKLATNDDPKESHKTIKFHNLKDENEEESIYMQAKKNYLLQNITVSQLALKLKKTSQIVEKGVIDESPTFIEDKTKKSRSIHKLGISMVAAELENKLKVMLAQCPLDISLLPYRMFNWDIQEIINRTTLPDTLYIDLIFRQFTRQEIEMLKMKVDLTEIIKMAQLIFKDFDSGQNLDKTIIPKLKHYEAATNFDIYLNQPLVKAKNKRDALIKEVESFASCPIIVKRPEDAFRDLFLETQITLLETFSPIETRYVTNWYRNVVAQVELSNQMKLDGIQKEIDRLKNLDSDNYFCTISSLQMHNISIDDFKMKIDQWSEKYEVDLEHTENENAILVNNIEKAKDELQECQDKLKKMRQKVAEVLEKIAKEETQQEIEAVIETPTKRRSVKKVKK